MSDTSPTPGAAGSPAPAGSTSAGLTALALAMIPLAGGFLRPVAGAWLADQPTVATWLTVFLAIVLQALPFLVLGVAASAAIAVFVSQDLVRRVLPRREAQAVPAAALAGALLPGCECASVPIAGSLAARGVPLSAALTFLLAAPAINPVVLVATAVAFAGDARVVAARFCASFLTAVVVGLWWLRRGRADLVRLRGPSDLGLTRRDRFTASFAHDVTHAGGYLVIGAAAAATVNVVLPARILDTLAGNLVVAVLTMAVFAVVVAVCSEADAFVAASLTAFPMSARLAFMVVGPVVDTKLIALQIGTFGRRFTTRFAPLTWGVAVGSAVAVAAVFGL